MLLDLKHREIQLTREIHHLEEEEEEEEEEEVITRIAGEEEEDNLNSTRSRIRTLLGRIRSRTSMGSVSRGESSSSSLSSPSSSSSGLFTISRDYNPQGTIPPPSQPCTSSHSDYSSLFVSSLSSSSLQFVSTPTPTQASMELVPTTLLQGDIIPREHSVCERPASCHSVLSRPTTSISTRTLPPPEEMIRKTSLPGVLLEQEDERVEIR